jgi:hypothetical protein
MAEHDVGDAQLGTDASVLCLSGQVTKNDESLAIAGMSALK